MKSRKDLLREYKERKKTAGVYRIRNTLNGKSFLASTLDLDGRLNSHRFRLSAGSHPNEALQRDWNGLGADAFAFETCETVAVKETPGFDPEAELSLLEEIWIERAAAEGGLYNTDKNLRRP
ncbi:MAG: GIY-YIG nuclease family protein [Spirochaetales bacterium]|nr:GIY-YIG nuclease family protein [Spirochaetales bacterium]